MKDRKVKGSMLLDFVRMIRANKDKDWNKYLKPEDWELIESRILASLWYPFELWQRCGYATFNVIGGGSMDAAKIWGRMSAKNMVEGIYKNVISDMEPRKVTERFLNLMPQFFNFLTIRYERPGEKHLKAQLDAYPDEPGTDAYLMQVKGGIEYLIERAGGKNPKVTFVHKMVDNEPVLEMEIIWE